MDEIISSLTEFKKFCSAFGTLLILLILMPGCSEQDKTDDERYTQAVSNFYIGLAASQTDELSFAFTKMNSVTESYPDEPAAWANLGVFAMRQGNNDIAAERLSVARELAPEEADILFLSGILESRRGNLEEAVRYFRKGTESDPGNFRLQFALIRELERKDDQEFSSEIFERLSTLKDQLPGNQVVLYELARYAAKENRPELLGDMLAELGDKTEEWGEEARDQLQVISDLYGQREISDILFELVFLRNSIEPEPSFQYDFEIVSLPPTEVGFLITRFLKLPQPELKAADPDHELKFDPYLHQTLPETADLVLSVTLLDDLSPFAIYLKEGMLHIDEQVILDFPGETASDISTSAVTEIDYNYSFYNDLALAGSDGFRLYRHNDDYTFTDVTGDLGLPGTVTDRAYRGVWAADIDLDGDLDLILAPADGAPVVLRNNGDGTFSGIDLFAGASGVIDFKWADLSGDGPADALFLTREGDLLLYRNFRGGQFRIESDLPVEKNVSAFAVADLDADGFFDIVAVKDDRSISRIYKNRRSGGWHKEVVTRELTGFTTHQPGHLSLFVSDLDNNGALDLLISGPENSSIWLGSGKANFGILDLDLPGRVTSVFDIDGSERLDLLGVTENGSPFKLMNTGGKDYGAFSVRARASGLEGDQRINSFGIGGEIEVRSGQLYQKQPIHSPIVHFGLGLHEEAEMLRIIWPNGSVQAEFAELGIGATIFNEQLLKGSCPWLFSHDGEEVRFITDALWRSPLGLRINAQETAGIIQTLDRVKIPGEKLANRDGVYDVRITAELWETHFFDYVELVAVDHPAGTEIFVDERFVFPPPDLSTRIVNSPQPVKRVTDQNGMDVTELVRSRDGTYLKAFEKSSYQGLVEEHFIEIEIGEDAPVDKPLYLIASGWLKPTDSSINLALSQGEISPPAGLRIDVSDGEGGWKTAHQDYGVPAGKLKTILIDLQGQFPDNSDRRVRMHTSSEIYWDSIQWADGADEELMVEQKLNPLKQELRYRGYSHWFRPDSVSPKLPDYSQISGTAPRWRDLIGFHTRFGDVRELLAEIDDRYVIMNAGDELLLEFEALDEPEEGWVRSFVFVSDGWVKDGDYNTEASKTVEPLPYHGQTDYEYSSRGTLMDDPVYQKHRSDWVNYHTRFITPEPFRSALIFQE